MKISLVLVLILVLSLALCPFAAAPLMKLSASQTQPAAAQTDTFFLLRTGTNKTEALSPEAYLCGVLAAEAAPETEPEALKALCVACRSYTLYRLDNGLPLTDDPAECQGYWDDAIMRAQWGAAYDERLTRFSAAVAAVKDEVLLYDGKPILAAYHALSPGKTESAAIVWGKGLPYLQSVVADGDVLSPKLEQRLAFSKEEFYTRAETLDGANLKTTSRPSVGKSRTTDSGYVQKIRLGDGVFSGEAVQAAFDLPSAFFSLKQTDDGFVFETKGSGHGVGMSLNSADFMARQGSDYKEILAHFYPGTTLIQEDEK